jgi:hypothetical protein
LLGVRGMTGQVIRLDDHRNSPASDDYFGSCPNCHRNDGYENVGSDHWFVCHQHRVKWCVGSNLFSSWRDQTDQERALVIARLATYREVEL